MPEIIAVMITIMQTRPNPPATSKSEPTINLQIRTHYQPSNYVPHVVGEKYGFEKSNI